MGLIYAIVVGGILLLAALSRKQEQNERRSVGQEHVSWTSSVKASQQDWDAVHAYLSDPANEQAILEHVRAVLKEVSGQDIRYVLPRKLGFAGMARDISETIYLAERGKVENTESVMEHGFAIYDPVTKTTPRCSCSRLGCLDAFYQWCGSTMRKTGADIRISRSHRGTTAWRPASFELRYDAAMTKHKNQYK